MAMMQVNQLEWTPPRTQEDHIIQVINGHVALPALLELGIGSTGYMKKVAQGGGWADERLTGNDKARMLKLAKENDQVSVKAPSCNWIHVAKLTVFLETACSQHTALWGGIGILAAAIRTQVPLVHQTMPSRSRALFAMP